MTGTWSAGALAPLLVTAASASIALLLALMTLRIRARGRAGREERVRERARGLLLAALLEEAQPARRAAAAMAAARGPLGREIEHQVFTMLPKVKGDPVAVLTNILRRRGTAHRAYRDLGSRSGVTRSRGAHTLGALRDRDAAAALCPLLQDRSFLVRRTAARALGQVGDPTCVTALLDAVSADPMLGRDVSSALHHLGPASAPALRAEVEAALPARARRRRGTIAASTLGLLGDLTAIPLLIDAVNTARHPDMARAAVDALGRIGSPEAVPALLEVDNFGDPTVRAAAATALGRIGDISAVSGLAGALDGMSRDSDRAVAAALVRLGDDGVTALTEHRSPYATEALAVSTVRADA